MVPEIMDRHHAYRLLLVVLMLYHPIVMQVLVLYDSHLVIEDVDQMNWILLRLNGDHNVYMVCLVRQSISLLYIVFV